MKNLTPHTNQMFKVGDNVIIIKDDRYCFTKRGSKGIVIKINNTLQPTVEFYYVPNNPSITIKPRFDIYSEDLELVELYKRDIKKIYQELKQPYK